MRGMIGLGAVLVVAWLVGLVLFKTAGFLIHLLLLVGAVMLVIGLVKRGSRAMSRGD
jgi:hypothetical protein